MVPASSDRLRKARNTRRLPKTRMPALAIKKLFREVSLGRVKNATTTPPIMPISRIRNNPSLGSRNCVLRGSSDHNCLPSPLLITNYSCICGNSAKRDRPFDDSGSVRRLYGSLPKFSSSRASIIRSNRSHTWRLGTTQEHKDSALRKLLIFRSTRRIFRADPLSPSLRSRSSR